MEVVRQGQGENEGRGHRHHSPAPPLPVPGDSIPTFRPCSPPCRCCRLQQRQGPAWIPWHLVGVEACPPPCPQTPNRPFALEASCFPTHFQIGSPPRSHPCPTWTPHCHGHNAVFCCTQWPRCFWSLLSLPSPSSYTGFRGREPSPGPTLVRSPRSEDNTPKAPAVVLSSAQGEAVFLSGNITIL